MDKVKVKSSTGFECTIDAAAMNDMELLDELVAMDRGEVTVIGSIIDRLLGRENKARLYDHVRVDGRVPIDAISKEIAEIFKELSEGKK